MADTNIGKVPLGDRRPLSPHIQIYKPMLTMVMSITHRITGGALYFGAVLLAWFLIALAAGPGPFATVSAVYGSVVGQLILFFFTWAVFQHLCGGIRHFIYDQSFAMGHPQREVLTMMTAVGGLALAAIVWIIRFVV